GGLSKAELFDRLNGTVEEACGVIEGLDGAALAGERTIQGYPVTVLEAVYHVVEHFAMHAGQIMFATKALTGEDLGFYRHLAKGAPVNHEEKTP
ncbi:MAG: DinB family protein, partial [Bryobacterales bacterium]|nr:DinB family protein [Bryobacterales bacterium]